MENGNAPATKQDIERVEQRIMQKVEEGIEQLRSEVNHGYNDLIERFTDGETRLLKAFYGFAETNTKRISQVEGNEAAPRSRLATVEERLMQVEKRLYIPPMQ